MSVQALSRPAGELEAVLAAIAACAGELDRSPRFPTESLEALARAGATAPATGLLADDVRLVRMVAAADGSTARILDGHLNGTERIALAAPEPLRAAELERVASGGLLIGVWGADPAPGEGAPARLERRDGQRVLDGVKTFCSGAGGVDRALVIASGEDGARCLAYLDATDQRVEVDRGWYRASGLRASESHRVVFRDAPVLAVLGGPGELAREPWFSRDAVRTSATWAGLADAILAETLGALDPQRVDASGAHMLGRMRVASATIDRWLDHACSVLDDQPPPVDPGAVALECRFALSESVRTISELAARLCGSRALVGASALDRARRDLDLFLLQHRLDPKLAELGARTMRGAVPR